MTFVVIFSALAIVVALEEAIAVSLDWIWAMTWSIGSIEIPSSADTPPIIGPPKALPKGESFGVDLALANLKIALGLSLLL